MSFSYFNYFKTKVVNKFFNNLINKYLVKLYNQIHL